MKMLAASCQADLGGGLRRLSLSSMTIWTLPAMMSSVVNVGSQADEFAKTMADSTLSLSLHEKPARTVATQVDDIEKAALELRVSQLETALSSVNAEAKYVEVC